MAEASFLQSHRARTEGRDCSNSSLNHHHNHDYVHHRSNHKEKSDRLHAFWASFKAFRNAWNDRLQQVVMDCSVAIVVDDDDCAASSDVVVTTPSALASRATQQLPRLDTESDKRRVHLELCLLGGQLKELRKICLSSSTTTTTTPAVTTVRLDEDRNNRCINLLLLGVHSSLAAYCVEPDDDFSATDMRLLHRDLTQCQANLDAAHHQLLPKGKFVFARYRRALTMQQQQASAAATADATSTTTDNGGSETSGRCNSRGETTTTNDETSTCPTTTDKTILLKTDMQNNKSNTLQDLDSVTVVVQPDGRVDITEESTLSQLPPQKLDGNAGQLVLRDLCHCTVTLLGSSYKALHLVNVVNCSIHVPHVIQGAAHVTKCRHSVLTLRVQQLRLHESSDLTCRVAVSAGAILEECNRIAFFQIILAAASTSHHHPLEVKDFDWLRNGIPSPNYTIERIILEEGEDVAAVEAFGALSLTRETNSSNGADANVVVSRDMEAQSGDDSDDDEL